MLTCTRWRAIPARQPPTSSRKRRGVNFLSAASLEAGDEKTGKDAEEVDQPKEEDNAVVKAEDKDDVHRPRWRI